MKARLSGHATSDRRPTATLAYTLTLLSTGIGAWLVTPGARAESDTLFYAPPAAQEDSPGFAGHAELGYTELSGNTNTKTLLAKGRLTWFRQAWTHTFRAEAKSVRDSGNTSAEQYLLGQRERYSLAGPHYLFGLARWEKERFSGYDNQFTTIAGYGRQLIDSDRHQLSVEAGPGYRFDDFEGGGSKHNAVGYAAADYDYYFSDTVSFTQQGSVEAASYNVTARSFTAITVALNAKLSLQFSHELKSNTNPPDTAEAHTDRTTAASVIYNF